MADLTAPTPTEEPAESRAPGSIAHSARATARQMSGMERLARSTVTTVLAAAGELFEVAIIGAVVDLLVAQQLQRGPYIDHGYSLTTLLVTLAVVQYVLVGIELVARYRNWPRGLALPLAFVPLGRTMRLGVMLTACTVVLVPKLLIYFLTLTVGIPIIELLRWMGASWATRLIDTFDVFFEPVEKAVNWLYNFLYFNKIAASGSTFTALFNLPLTLWCLNH